MSDPQYAYRSSRDRVIDFLFNRRPLPIRDLNFYALDNVVAYNDMGILILENSQLGTEYTLVDISTDPIGTPYGPILEGNGGDLKFTTSQLTNRYYTYRLIARKFVQDGTMRTYFPEILLRKTVTVYSGLNLDLTLDLVQFIIDYDTTATVIIRAAQVNVRYELYDKATGMLMGTDSSGVGGDLYIETPQLTEEIEIEVKAINLIPNQTDEGFLNQTIIPGIRPNPIPGITLQLSPIDYNASPVVEIANSEVDTQYVVRRAWLDDDSWDASTQMNEAVSQTVFGNGGQLTIPVDPHVEDATLNVLAIKDTISQGGAEQFGAVITTLVLLQLSPTLDLQIYPDPDRAVIAQASPVPVNTTGLVQLPNPQDGIIYCLRNNVNNAKIGQPIFFNWDRGVNETAINFDFRVGTFVGTQVDLVTSTIDVTKTFNVLATKARTGVAVEMNTLVTIDPI